MKNRRHKNHLLKVLMTIFIFQHAGVAGNTTNNQVAQVSGGGIFNLNHNIIQGGKSLISGTVNISNNDATDAQDTDPLFININEGNLNVQPASPAINAGNNNLIPDYITTDINGNLRINDTYIDLGAFESDTSLGDRKVETINNINVYPNPASNYLFIECREYTEQVRLYDLVGKQVQTLPQTFAEGIIWLDVSILERGVYLLQINKTTHKIILQ